MKGADIDCVVTDESSLKVLPDSRSAVHGRTNDLEYVAVRVEVYVEGEAVRELGSFISRSCETAREVIGTERRYC